MFARLKNSWLLFTTTLSFIKKDRSLLAVPVILPFANLGLLIILAVMAFGVFIFGARTELAWFAFGVIALFLSFLLNTFFAAAHSWMVFEVAKGKDTTLSSGLRRASHNLADIIWFSIVMTLVHVITGLLRGKRQNGMDIGSAIRNMLANMIEGLVGILGKLVLPAMIVTDKTFKEAVVDLKRSAKTWPEVLAFEIGLGPLFGLAFFAIAIVLGLLAYAVSPFIGMYALIAFIISLVIVIIAMGILSKFVNATYYTLLYLALVEKKHIHGVKELFHTKF